MTQLYKRNLRLTIGSKVGSPSMTISPGTLRVSFSINRTAQPEPGSATIRIFNLNANSRALAEVRDNVIAIEVAYASEPLKTIFLGTIITGTHNRVGSDIETIIEAGDGDYAYRQATISGKLDPGTSIKTVFEMILASLLAVPGAFDKGINLDSNAMTIIDKAGGFATSEPLSKEALVYSPSLFLKGIVLHGWSRDLLSNMCDRHLLTWFWVNQTLTIVPVFQSLSLTPIIQTPATGVIGSPKKLSGGKISFQTLLNPAIVPRSLITLDGLKDTSINGEHIAQRVNVTGDTHGTPWYTDIETLGPI